MSIFSYCTLIYIYMYISVQLWDRCTYASVHMPYIYYTCILRYTFPAVVCSYPNILITTVYLLYVKHSIHRISVYIIIMQVCVDMCALVCDDDNDDMDLKYCAHDIYK